MGAGGQIRVGVVAYHDTVYEAIHIDDFPNDPEGLKNRISRLTRRLSPSGNNDLAAAFDYVKLTSFAGARPGAAKVVVPIVHMMPQASKLSSTPPTGSGPIVSLSSESGSRVHARWRRR